MPVEMDPDRSTSSFDITEPVKKVEPQKCEPLSSNESGGGLEKKAAEVQLQPNIQSLYKQMKYEASLAYTQATQNAWWTKIEPYNIYLGALPLKNKGHLEQIVDLGVTRILSMVEDFEMEDGYLNSPVKAGDWEQKGIVAHQIKAVDFLPLSRSEISIGVESLAQSLKEGHKVYVHCKAGRGRSATIVIAYLMQYHKLSYDEAFSLVKNQRPQINLNPQQRQAILDYFAKGQAPIEQAAAQSYLQLSEEKLTQTLESMLDYVIDGSSYSLGTHVPEALAGWMPSMNVESTLSRRNRYLREYEGDQNAATEAAIARNHGLIRRAKIAIAGIVPFVGMPTSYSISLWHQLREIALIAALNGHDVHDPEVKVKMLSALVGGNVLKVPAASVDLVARLVIKKILTQAGLSSVPGIPAHVIFNFFTDNAAKVSTHAKALFAGENSKPIPSTEYFTSR